MTSTIVRSRTNQCMPTFDGTWLQRHVSTLWPPLRSPPSLRSSSTAIGRRCSPLLSRLIWFTTLSPPCRPGRAFSNVRGVAVGLPEALLVASYSELGAHLAR